MKNKKSQEEILGFALIMIVVAVVLLVFLGFSLRKSQKEIVENYEAESFIETVLQYTTDCAKTYEPNYLSIQKLISECNNQETCLDGSDACVVLELELAEIVEEIWEIGEETPVKGYELNVTSNNEEMINIKEGNTTNNYKGGMQELPKEINVLFTAYY